MSKEINKNKAVSKVSGKTSKSSNDNKPKEPVRVYGRICAGGSAQSFWEYKDK